MKELEQKDRLAAPPDAVLALLTDEAAILERNEREGALDCQVREIERSDTRLVYEVIATRYGRTLTGAEDRSKTTQNTTRHEWDLTRRRDDYVVDVGQGERVRTDGTVELEPDGDGTLMTSRLVIEVKIPLLGRKIEKMVVSAMKKEWPTFIRLLEEQLASSG